MRRLTGDLRPQKISDSSPRIVGFFTNRMTLRHVFICPRRSRSVAALAAIV
jgi:hypothetical protein